MDVEYKDIVYVWEDCSICFVCPKCKNHLIADSQNGYENCECGFKYALSVKLVFCSAEPF